MFRTDPPPRLSCARHGCLRPVVADLPGQHGSTAISLPFGDGAFSTATTIYAPARPAEVIQELRPGGRFVATTATGKDAAERLSASSGTPTVKWQVWPSAGATATAEANPGLADPGQRHGEGRLVGKRH